MPRKLSAKARLQKKLQQKEMAPRSLTWEILEIIYKDFDLFPQLLSACENLKLKGISTFKDAAKIQKDPKLFTDCLHRYTQYLSTRLEVITTEQMDKILTSMRTVFILLKENKAGGEKITIEEGVYGNLIEILLLQSVYPCYKNGASLEELDQKTLDKSLEWSQSVFQISLFLLNDCLILNKDHEVKPPVRDLVLISVLTNLIKSLLDLGQTEEVRKYLPLLKIETSSSSDKFIKLLGEETYYRAKSLIALAARNYPACRDYFLKTRRAEMAVFDMGWPISDESIRLGCILASQLVGEKNMQDALVFLRIVSDFINKNIFLADPEKKFSGSSSPLMIKLGLQNVGLTRIKAGDLERYTSWLEHNEENVTSLEKICLHQYISYFNELSGGHFFAASTPYTDYSGNEKFQMKIIFKNRAHLQAFFDLCDSKNIICSIKESNLLIAKPLDLKPVTIRKITSQWLQCISVAEKSDALAPINPNRNTDAENKASSSPSEDKFITPSPTSRVPEKMITWSKDLVFRKNDPDCIIYKLYSSYFSRIYVRIDPTLIEFLHTKNKLALRDLVRMCEVGHVLGNSKGRKGFIISSHSFYDKKKKSPVANEIKNVQQNPGEKQQVLFMKSKNPSKDWRIYGESNVKKINDKWYYLFTMNTYCESHKKKPITPEKLNKLVKS